MFRKFFLLVGVAIVGMATVSSSASAQGIEVHNPGMFQFEGQALELWIHNAPGESLIFQCTNDWEANVEADGHTDIHDIDFSYPGVGSCQAVNDCNDAGWEWQLEADGSGGYEADVSFCIVGVLPSSLPLSASAHCDIDNDGDEVHCGHQTVFNQNPPPAAIGGATFELEGEIGISGDPIDLEYTNRG